MAPKNPIEFLRRLLNGNTQLAGNHVQLEDHNGADINAANPLPVQIPVAFPAQVDVTDRAARLLGVTTANQGAAGAAAWPVDPSDRAARDNGKIDIAAFDVSLPTGANKIGAIDPVTATPTLYNVTCVAADTEYSQALPANCRLFEFQARTEATLRFAFVTGKVAGSVAPYQTLKAGDYYFSPAINQGASPSTLYVASPTAGTVVEIIAWA